MVCKTELFPTTWFIIMFKRMGMKLLLRLRQNAVSNLHTRNNTRNWMSSYV